MLIEQSFEPLVQYNEERLKSVLNLPKKVLIESVYIYKLKLTFIESTYIKLAYVEANGDVLVEMKFNLNEHTEEYIDQLYDYLESKQAIDTELIEKRFTEYGISE